MGTLLSLPMSFMKIFISSEEDKPLTFRKFVTILCLRFWRLFFEPRIGNYDYDERVDLKKCGIMPSKSEWKLETPQEDTHLVKAADEVMLYGVNSKGECLMVRIARNFDETAEVWLYLRLQNGKSFVIQETGKSTDNKTFNAAGLRMQCLSPLRIWRIFFNGLLKVDEEELHVKFSFIWSALSNVYDTANDIDVSELANALPNIPWRKSSLEKFFKVLDVYEQAGNLRGTVNIEGEEEIEMYLWGTKLRMLGEPDMFRDGKFYNVFGYTEDGIILHVGYGTVSDHFVNLQHGYVVTSVGHLFPIRTCSRISTGRRSDDPLIRKKFKFLAGERGYGLKVMSSIHSTTFATARWSDDIEIKLVNIKLNGDNGKALIISGKFKDTSKSCIHSPAAPISITRSRNVSRLVVPFDWNECHEVDLTGGKGSSLGKLTKIAQKSDKFIVPKGIVVTTAAYKEFFKLNHLQEVISTLEDVAWRQTKRNLQGVCERTVDKVTNTTIPGNVFKAIKEHLEKIYGNSVDTVRFAVRSSASGEDSEELSAAGQMDTFLGIRGMDNIMAAIKKCWASQFSFVATEYKRQNGQLLNTPMAVVIQEMAYADVAGVMFTCDPVTYNPKYITITANYGLGESVVSAKAEPDVIVLQRKNGHQLLVHSTTIGKKNKKIVIDENDGVKEIENISDESCSLTNEQALLLGEMGLQLQEEFGSPRDIEWCFANNQLYLLQSRPITSITAETEFEIAHEFDTMFRCEDECLSKGNVGEVMPDATSPLGLSFMMKFFTLCFTTKSWRQREGKKVSSCPFFPKGIATINNHVLFNVVDGWLRHGDDKDSAATKAMMIAAIGRMLDDDNLYRRAKERYSDCGSFSQKFYNIIFLMQGVLFAEKHIEEARKKFFEFQMDLDKYSTAQEFHEDVTKYWDEMTVVLDPHGECSFLSALYNTVLITILAHAHGEWNNDVYADFAYLLSTCNKVESADVPSSLENLAKVIAKDIGIKAFKEMDPEEALRWLKASSTDSSVHFKRFIERHGHRGLKEFDVQASPWNDNSIPLIKTLQNLVATSIGRQKSIVSMEDAIKNLRAQLDLKTRLFMKFLLPKCRNAVGMRERTKSLLIKAFDIIRKSYGHLAKMMVQEGRLPDEELLFFLGHDEIELLIETRSSNLIAKAKRRRRLHPKLNSMKFPEITYGIPKPINTEVVQNGSCKSLSTMKGIPVSCGVAKGTAKVILHLEDAHTIQHGDILITYSTDIGWSPYFPLLGGVVTEIGGLISHGAVVAREYGLPCVVAIPGVTMNFSTGDNVLIDGNKGLIQKIEVINDIQS